MTVYYTIREILLHNATAISLQNAKEGYYKIRQIFYYNMRHVYYKRQRL